MVCEARPHHRRRDDVPFDRRCPEGGELDAAQTLDDPCSGALPLRLPTRVPGMT